MSDVGVTVRARVRDRASGRCEYCLVPESFTLVEHEVDHIVAVKHGGVGVDDNLALCCTLCNRHKGSDLASIDPATGRVEQLFHPRRDRWEDHFRLDSGEIVGLSPAGRTTVRLLQLNRPARIRERQLLARVSKIEPDERRRRE